MAQTRNDIIKEPRQAVGVVRRNDPMDATRRRIRLATAESEFNKTGNIEPYKAEAQAVKEKTLGGSTEQFNLDQGVRKVEEKNYNREVTSAKETYKEAATEENATKLKETINKGFNLFGQESTVGTQIRQNLRSVDTTENNRKLADIQSNWKTDPAVHTQEFKDEIGRQINYYGENSLEGVKLREKLRTVDEQGILNEVHTAMNDYELDPVAAIDRLRTAQEKLVQFYGSSSDAYYARQTLNNINQAEQTRLDDMATNDYNAGVIGYDSYKSYLDASLAKYPEGSDEYMKYFKSSKSLEFNKTLDDLIRLQYDQPQGKVMEEMKKFQGSLQPGSDAYNKAQDQIDNLEYQIRYSSYNDMLKKEVQERQEEVNGIQIKLYNLDQDFADGKITKSQWQKKTKSYNNKVDYLSSSTSLPAFEIYKKY